MEFSKKKLISIMEEVKNMESDIDEMAKRSGKVQAPRKDPETGEYIIYKTRYVWKDTNPTPIGEDGFPDAIISNVDQIPGGERVLIPIGCQDLEQFKVQNKEWLESIGLFYEVSEYQYEFCEGEPLKHNPIRSLTGKKQAVKTTNYRLLMKILRDEFDEKRPNGAKFKEELLRRSIPQIIFAEKHDDNYEKYMDNDRIFLRTHTFNTYESPKDFLRLIQKRVSGRELVPSKSEYSPRQFNPIYKKYEPQRKATQTPDATKTPIYKLDKQGYDPRDIRVMLKMVFSLEGKREGNDWVWTIKMENFYGRRTPEQYTIQKGLEKIGFTPNEEDIILVDPESEDINEKPLIVTKRIPLPDKTFDDNNPIMGDISVVTSLEQTINDFKNLVSSINPRETLSLGNIRMEDIPIENINESVKVIMNRIKKLKNGKSY